MNSLLLIFLASCFAALSNLFFRLCLKQTNHCSSIGYLLFFYLSSFIVSLAIYPEIWKNDINFIMLGLGAIVGILNSFLMSLTFNALKTGPAGLTFAFQNSSAVFPGVILFFVLGANFGFSCTPLQMLGMALVLCGLFYGVKRQEKGIEVNFRWIKLILFLFLVQILALTLIQSRYILFDFLGELNPAFVITDRDDSWFMPGLFGAASLIQLVRFIFEINKLNLSEAMYGTLGGIANFSTTLLLLCATKYALPVEKTILFPCFAVGTIILCNFWANRLYKEKFNLETNALCSFGIFMATSPY